MKLIGAILVVSSFWIRYPFAPILLVVGMGLVVFSSKGSLYGQTGENPFEDQKRQGDKKGDYQRVIGDSYSNTRLGVVPGNFSKIKTDEKMD